MIKVMVVEDEPPIARMISNIISEDNDDYKVICTAINGKKALDEMEKNAIDVVFTDVSMPVMNGIELSKQISEKYPNIITVIISGYQEFEYARQAISYNVFEYLLKPIDKKLLKETLNKIKLKIKDAKLKEIKINLINNSDNNNIEDIIIINNDNKEKYHNKIVYEIEEFLIENYNKNISNTILSQRFGFVSSYLSKMFRAYKGVSPSEFIIKYRIEKAKIILKTRPDLMIKEVASMLGFSDQYYFSKTFKKHTNKWPTEYTQK